MPIISAIKRRVAIVRKVASVEQQGIAVFRVMAWIAYTVEIKLAAYLVGWKNSYLGRGSRVIGTRFMQIDGFVNVGRYAWIEAVFEYGSQRYTPKIILGRGFCASECLHISAIERIEIGENCLVGSNVYISDHNHGSYKGVEQSRPDEPPAQRALNGGAVLIGNNVWIGDKVTIVGPICIGDGAIVGSNTVVTKDVPEGVIIVGMPAKIIKRYCAEKNQWEKSI